MATFCMVYGDHGSSLALVSRYAFSLSCFFIAALAMSVLSPMIWILSLRIPSLSIAAVGCLIFSAVELDFGSIAVGGIAASLLALLYAGRSSIQKNITGGL